MIRPGDLAACERLINEIEGAGWGWSLRDKERDGFLVFVSRRGDFPAVCHGRGPSLPLALNDAFHAATTGLLKAQLEASQALVASARPRPARTLIANGAAS